MSRSGLAVLLCAAAVTAGAACVPAAWAGSPQGKDERTPSQLALEGIDRLMQALGLLIDTIPQYEAPVINQDGDIIIRRKRDHGGPALPDDRSPPPSDGDTMNL